MVENESGVIELEEITFYMHQKNKLERIKGTCQINLTCKEISGMESSLLLQEEIIHPLEQTSVLGSSWEGQKGIP